MAIWIFHGKLSGGFTKRYKWMCIHIYIVIILYDVIYSIFWHEVALVFTWKQVVNSWIFTPNVGSCSNPLFAQQASSMFWRRTLLRASLASMISNAWWRMAWRLPMCLRHFSELFEGTSSKDLQYLFDRLYNIYYIYYIYVYNVYIERERKSQPKHLHMLIYTRLFFLAEHC